MMTKDSIKKSTQKRIIKHPNPMRLLVKLVLIITLFSILSLTIPRKTEESKPQKISNKILTNIQSSKTDDIDIIKSTVKIETPLAREEHTIQYDILNPTKIHAFTIKYPLNQNFEISFNQQNFFLSQSHDEGILDSDFSYTNLIYTPEGWDGNLYIRSEEKFEFEVSVIPDSKNISTEILTFKTQNLNPLGYSSESYSGAMATTLNIIPRSVWGGNTSNWDPNSNLDINSPARLTWDVGYYRADKIVVHHTATPYTIEPSQAIRDIYLYHAYSRGWGDIGYNYLIDQNGNIYEGKLGGEGVFSYHAYREANASSVSIALIGDFTNIGPTAAAKDSLAKLIAEKSIFYNLPIRFTNDSSSDWVDSAISVYGHRSSYRWENSQWTINSTACPGNTFNPILSSEVINLANTYVNSTQFDNLKDIVSDVESMYSSPNIAKSGELLLNYDQNLTPSEVINSIPNYSAITSNKIFDRYLQIKIEDWDNGGHMPTNGWTGLNTQIFPSNLDWRNERTKTLQKVFLLDSNWNFITRDFKYTTQ